MTSALGGEGVAKKELGGCMNEGQLNVSSLADRFFSGDLAVEIFKRELQ